LGRCAQLEPDRREWHASVRGGGLAGSGTGGRAPGRRRTGRRGSRVRRRVAVLRHVGRGKCEAMNFAFTDEQEELRRTVRKFLESRSPMSETRRLMETDEGYDDVVWKQMAQELALQGIHVPEEYGGQGFSFVELGIVLHELGCTLLTTPYFSSMSLDTNVI